MKIILLLAAAVTLASCATFDLGQKICVPAWDAKFANKLGDEADALPADAAIREALGQLADLRKALPRC